MNKKLSFIKIIAGVVIAAIIVLVLFLLYRNDKKQINQQDEVNNTNAVNRTISDEELNLLNDCLRSHAEALYEHGVDYDLEKEYYPDTVMHDKATFVFTNEDGDVYFFVDFSNGESIVCDITEEHEEEVITDDDYLRETYTGHKVYLYLDNGLWLDMNRSQYEVVLMQHIEVYKLYEGVDDFVIEFDSINENTEVYRIRDTEIKLFITVQDNICVITDTLGNSTTVDLN